MIGTKVISQTRTESDYSRQCKRPGGQVGRYLQRKTGWFASKILFGRLRLGSRWQRLAWCRTGWIGYNWFYLTLPVWVSEMKTMGRHANERASERASERCTRAAAVTVTAFRAQPLSLHDITICTKLRKIAAFTNTWVSIKPDATDGAWNNRVRDSASAATSSPFFLTISFSFFFFLTKRYVTDTTITTVSRGKPAWGQPSNESANSCRFKGLCLYLVSFLHLNSVLSFFF